MRFLPLALAVLLLSAGNPSSAQTNVYVDSSVSASGTGSSWSGAFKTLNEALAAANATTAATIYQIHVAKGTYYPTRIQSGINRDSTFILRRGNIGIFGGYPTGGGARNIAGNPTILSGDIGTKDDTTDNAYHVMLIGGLSRTDTIVISGLTFTRGNANGSGSLTVGGAAIPRAWGGGLAIVRSRSRVFIDSCEFIRNAAGSNSSLGYGGGIMVYNDPPNTGARPMLTMRNCLVFANTAFGGGGMSNTIDGATDSILNCRFVDNRAMAGGGGISCALSTTQTDSSTLYMADCSITGNNQGGLVVTNNTPWLNGATTAVIARCDVSNNTEVGASFSLSSDAPREANCTVTDCTFLHNASVNGAGGISTRVTGIGSNSNLRFRNCTISGNTTQLSGGGMNNGVNSSPRSHLYMTGCTVSGNASKYFGGGMNNDNLASITATGIEIDSCFIINNHSDNIGGGVSNSQSSATFLRTTISGNDAASSAGVHNDNSSPVFNSCLFSGNRATTGVAGAMRNYGSSPGIVNCTFAGDTAKGGGAAMYNDASGSRISRPTVVNSIIWEGSNSILNSNSSNYPTITYSTVQGGFTGTGNNATVPAFFNPLPQSAAPTTGGDYRLPACSPLNNTGTNSSSYTAFKDLDGNARVFGVIDRGAYEFPDLYPSVIRGDTNLCIGRSLQYTNLIPGGTWSNRNTAVATLSATGFLNTAGVGNDTLYYSAPAVGSCAAHLSSKIIRVYPYPVVAAITGRDTVCIDGTTQLTTVTPGGVWMSSNTAVATVSSSGLVRPVSPGIDTIRYTVKNAGDCSTTVERVVHVMPLPAIGPITGANQLCGIGARAQLGNVLPGGVWTSSNPGVASIDASGVAEAVSAGNTTLRYVVTSPAVCVSDTTRQLRVVTIETGVTRNDMFLTANLTHPLAVYVWYHCDFPYELGHEQTFEAPQGGTYKVVISMLGCSDTSDCIPVVANSVTGVPGGESVKVYPNPASGQVFVSGDAALGRATIRIKDMAGRTLRETRAGGTSPQAVGLGGIAPGIYLLEVEVGAAKTTRRLSVN